MNRIKLGLALLMAAVLVSPAFAQPTSTDDGTAAWQFVPPDPYVALTWASNSDSIAVSLVGAAVVADTSNWLDIGGILNIPASDATLDENLYLVLYQLSGNDSVRWAADLDLGTAGTFITSGTLAGAAIGATGGAVEVAVAPAHWANRIRIRVSETTANIVNNGVRGWLIKKRVGQLIGPQR